MAVGFAVPCRIVRSPLSLNDLGNLYLLSFFPDQSGRRFINLVDLLKEPVLGFIDFSLLFFHFLLH